MLFAHGATAKLPPPFRSPEHLKLVEAAMVHWRGRLSACALLAVAVCLLNVVGALAQQQQRYSNGTQKPRTGTTIKSGTTSNQSQSRQQMRTSGAQSKTAQRTNQQPSRVASKPQS